MSKSPYDIGYKDLITEQRIYKSFLERKRLLMHGQGERHLDGINRSILIADRILKLLEKSDRNPQTDLFKLNEELNRK